MVLFRKKKITLNIKNINKNLMNDSFIDNSFFNQIVSLFFKYGLKLKKVVILRYYLVVSTWTSVFNLESSQPNPLYQLINKKLMSSSTGSWEASFRGFFINLNNLSLLIKQDGTNRQVRKYSKGKFKYRSRVFTVGDSNVTNFLLRFWKIILFALNTDDSQLEKFFFTTLVNINLNDYNDLKFNPYEVQLSLLDKYFKKKIQ